jgi:hypothetical protein
MIMEAVMTPWPPDPEKMSLHLDMI